MTLIGLFERAAKTEIDKTPSSGDDDRRATITVRNGLTAAACLSGDGRPFWEERDALLRGR